MRLSIKLTQLSVKLFLCLGLLLSSLSVFAKESADALKSLPVQDSGRVKPFDTFAREALTVVHGKKTYESRPAHMIVMTWILDPASWMDKEFVEISNADLKKSLKFDVTQKYFSFKNIRANERLGILMQELDEKRKAKEKLNGYYQAVQRIETQIGFFEGIARGKILNLMPPVEGTSWLPLESLKDESASLFEGIIKSFLQVIASYSDASINGKEAQKNLAESISRFKEYASQQNPNLYPSDFDMNLEVHYNEFHPFLWTWIIYLLSALSVVLLWVTGREFLYKSGWILMIIGFLIHSYGFALRCYITQRPPVTNMYETVIWVSFGVILFTMIIEFIYKFRFTLLIGSLVATFCLILSDMSPTILDPSLHPLEPVLRSNYWLTIHVLTISISYAAFFLAFGLADASLIYYLLGESKHKEILKKLNTAIYRSIQIGVMLLGPGIILGGIWADYSWGRFWGWDPKETWALIAFLGYLAVLHGRISGLIKQFGLVLCAVITFSLVIMAWYGVNYVLGAGLHTYGFGGGGLEYVSGFILLHTMFVIYVAMMKKP